MPDEVKFWSWFVVTQLTEYYIEKIFVEKFGGLKVNFCPLLWQGIILACPMLIVAYCLSWSNGHPEA